MKEWDNDGEGDQKGGNKGEKGKTENEGRRQKCEEGNYREAEFMVICIQDSPSVIDLSDDCLVNTTNIAYLN